MKNIIVDFSKTLGPMKIMHAVNNGPAGSKTRQSLNNFDLFQAARIPYARNHDASFFYDYGGEHTVDVHRIFTDFDADVNDPASYDFRMTDRYMQDILSVGAKPFYRLGASIEHHKKVGTFPPRDNQKWAEICEHIIRHYNEGWADGYEMGIEYWEIWNEPDCRNADGTNPCWQGTPEQFAEFFVTALGHLKACFPKLKIGGPAICTLWNEDYTNLVLSAVEKAGLSLDFFSFHSYDREPSGFYKVTEKARGLLRKYGLEEGTELILNEWNYIRGWLGEDFEYSIRSIKGIKGASFIVGAMCEGQRARADMLMYYDARPCGFNGMFDTDYRFALKGYYPFPAFADLYDMGTNVAVESEEGLYCTAALGEHQAGFLVTWYQEDDTIPGCQVRVDFSNLPLKSGCRLDYYLLDDDHNMELVRSEKVAGENFVSYLNFDLYTTWLVKIVEE